MKAISSVKESFAFAGCDISAREKVIAQTLVVGTEDWCYYRGLVLLQKLSSALSDTLTIRSPTEQERVLLNDLEHHLKDYKDRFHNATRYMELESRFYLLTWFINNDASKRFIQNSLHLNLPMAQHNQDQHNDNIPSPSFQSTTWESQQQQQQQQQQPSFATDTEKTYPSSLDASLLDQDRFMWQLLKTNQLDQLKFKAWPIIQQHWPQLNNDQRTKILARLLERPVSTTYDTLPIPIVDYLVDIWRPFETNNIHRRGVLAKAVGKIPLYNLTLDQMDQLQTMLPGLLHIDDFVKAYIEKLVPDTFAQNSVGFFTGNQAWWNEWEYDDAAAVAAVNGPSTWDLYLDALDRFADKLLDGPFRLMKARITFQKLRSGLLHGVFDQSLLLAFLSQSQVNIDGFSNATTKRYQSSSLFGQSEQTSSINVPLLGSCDIPTTEKTQVIKHYITGLLQTQKLESLAVIGHYLDQKTFLEPLQAEVMLTSGLAKNEDVTGWSKVLGSTAFANLTNRTILTFGLKTIHDARNSKLTQDDVIPVHVTLKNIPRLTIRIFPIDLFNYWKLHPDDSTIKDGNKLNVDGLCPVYEHQLDYSDIPSLQIVDETFVFGGGDSYTGKSIATELFQGRGAWMIDFIGGQNQSRAIVQKGYLRHATQYTAAGHLFRIMDEKLQPMGDACSLWFENNTYEADESGDILIPYRSKDTKKVRALIVAKTGYCQPIEFYHQEERYSLTYTFYLNYEGLVPTKQTKIIILPTLMIQDQVLPLKLLEKLSLQIITTNTSNIKSSTSIDNIKIVKGKPLECEFIVPKSLVSIKLTLSAKIRTMSKDEPWKHLEFTREIRDNGSDQDEITTTHMRTSTTGYHLCVIGKNGEPHKRHVVELSFTHTLTLNTIEITMQTDENGQIFLGTLDRIQSVTAKELGKTWNLLGDNWESVGNCDEVALPATIHYYANTEFEVPFAVGDGCNCTLYKTAFRKPLIADYTDRLKYTDSTVTVLGGLPEGHYYLYLTRPHQRHDNLIEVIIMKDSRTQHNPAISAKSDTFWNDWIINSQNYGKVTRDIVKQPLGIENVKITNDTLTLKLKNAPTSVPTFAIVTTSAFLSSLSDSLSNSKMKGASFRRLLAQKMKRTGTEHIYLTGRTLGEELQYILNRTKEDKYLGSTLAEPTLLVNPKENKRTNIMSRTTGKGNHGFTGETKQKHPNTIMFGSRGDHRSGRGNPFEYTNFDFDFLNHSTCVLILPPNNQGEIIIDRSQLGDGNLLQAVVLSGDQMVSRTLVLPDVKLTLKLNDQRQTDQDLDVNAAYLRNKIITVLSPSHPQNTMEIDQTQHESELIGSQEVLLDIFKLLAPHQSKELTDFDILRQWGTWSDDEKLKAHDEMNCHELNLWVKYKDGCYFENNIKPFIKSKLHKTFMDDYLIDADLSTYANDLYLFQQLNTAEKALLAKRVPQILPVVLQIFKDHYTKSLSDQPFDTVLAGNALNLPVSENSNAFGFTTMPPPPPPPAPISTGYNGPSEPSGVTGSSQGKGGFGSNTQPQHTTQSRVALGFGSAAPQPTKPKPLFGSPAPPPPPPPPSAPSASIFGAASPAASIFSAVTTQTSTVSPAFTDSESKDPDTDYDGTDIYDNVNGGSDSEDNEIDTIMKLRNQAAKRRQDQQHYEYMEKTVEWEEREYYDKAPGMINVNQFWIDYLENKLDIFVSANAIYATNSIAEMIFALALLDLPIKLNSNYDVTSDLTTGKITITAATPVMLFYRSLKKYTQPLVANHTLLIGQHIFEKSRNSDGSTGEEYIVEPSQLLVHTPYGWHLAISNISTKPVVCEVMLQIPTGAVPLGETPYCQSMNIRIEPYTTWHEVVGVFYFPEQGTYYQFPVTIGGQQKDQQQDTNKSDGVGSFSITDMDMVLLNQTKPLVLMVNEIKRPNESNEQNQLQESTAPLSVNASWSVVNSTGTSDDILAFIENQDDKLHSLDWSLVMWRMTNRTFAQSLLNLLAGRKQYVKSIYAYGVYHSFTNIIVDLLVQERFLLLQKTGVVFDSPLVKWQAYGNHQHKILDYYPMSNARVHTLGSSQEIVNQEFFKHYDLFLTYMNESVQRTANDYLILSVYLILHGRIGEAHQAHIQSQKLFSERDGDHETTSIQADYLAAYLATRIKVGGEMDWTIVKKMVTKYKSCGSLKWRKLFAQLNALVVQAENCDLQDMDNDDDFGIMATTKANLGADPVFDFTIKDNQVVVRYANLVEMQVRFYNINVEVMFSNQPFLNKVNKMSDYGWVQANHVETIKLLDDQQNDDVVMVHDDANDDDDFGWIGVSKVRQRRHTFPIPLIGNLLVEIHAHGKTQCQMHYNHALTIHLSEQNGLARVLATDSLEHQRQKPLPGVYVKVYAKLINGGVEFWKDGYTGLTGIFDYISVTHGNALTGSASLEDVVKKVRKFALLFSSEQHGVVVKETGIPL